MPYSSADSIADLIAARGWNGMNPNTGMTRLAHVDIRFTTDAPYTPTLKDKAVKGRFEAFKAMGLDVSYQWVELISGRPIDTCP